MGLTHFPHGIMATPNLGATGRLIELFESDNIWFVDGDSGSDSNSGDHPDKAVALPSIAVGKASAYGSIYIKPRWTATGTDVTYSDNITIPVTKPGISLIGAGTTLPGYRGAAELTTASATTSIIIVQASSVTVENLQITGVHTSDASLINCVRNATYPAAVSLQVRGCRLIGADYGGSDGTYVYGAVALGSAQYSVIEDNIFIDCYGGVVLWATYGSPQSIVVRRNIFSGLVASRSTDVWFGCTDINSRGLVIDSNIFADGLPTAGRTKFIETGCSAETGMICNNFFGKSAGTYKTAGDTGKVGASMFLVGNYQEPTAEDLTAAGDHVGRTN